MPFIYLKTINSESDNEMIRIKRGFTARKRRKKILKMNRGFQTSSKNLFRIANQKHVKSKVSASRDRKKRKILFRHLWIHRINAATRLYGLSFNQFIKVCKQSKIQLNRKILSQLMIYDPESFFTEFKSSIYQL